MSIHAIIQARMSSSRLPGKVMKPILGKPMLARQIERLSHSLMIDTISIATSNDASDDQLYNFCYKQDIPCFRGSLDDVLDRFYQAAVHEGKAQNIVRLTGDCPLIDWRLVDELVNFHLDGKYDYSSNCLQPTLPDGLDAEIMTFSCLEKCWQKAVKTFEREHVTPFMYDPVNHFNIGSLQYKNDNSHLRWTVDEKEDFDLVLKIYEEFYSKNSDFSYTDILKSDTVQTCVQSSDDRFTRNSALARQRANDLNNSE